VQQQCPVSRDRSSIIRGSYPSLATTKSKQRIDPTRPGAKVSRRSRGQTILQSNKQRNRNGCGELFSQKDDAVALHLVTAGTRGNATDKKYKKRPRLHRKGSQRMKVRIGNDSSFDRPVLRKPANPPIKRIV
jgi:hypothetical protein